jgi:hypothetical protein
LAAVIPKIALSNNLCWFDFAQCIVFRLWDWYFSSKWRGQVYDQFTSTFILIFSAVSSFGDESLRSSQADKVKALLSEARGKIYAGYFSLSKNKKIKVIQEVEKLYCEIEKLCPVVAQNSYLNNACSQQVQSSDFNSAFANMYLNTLMYPV